MDEYTDLKGERERERVVRCWKVETARTSSSPKWPSTLYTPADVRLIRLTHKILETAFNFHFQHILVLIVGTIADVVRLSEKLCDRDWVEHWRITCPTMVLTCALLEYTH